MVETLSERRRKLEWLLGFQKKIAASANPFFESTKNQRQAIHICLTYAGIKKKEQRYAVLSALLGRPILSTQEIDKMEATTLLGVLLGEKGKSILEWVNAITPPDVEDAARILQTEYKEIVEEIMYGE